MYLNAFKVLCLCIFYDYNNECIFPVNGSNFSMVYKGFGKPANENTIIELDLKAKIETSLIVDWMVRQGGGQTLSMGQAPALKALSLLFSSERVKQVSTSMTIWTIIP